MSTVESSLHVLEETAELFASSPSPEQILRFRFSAAIQQRAADLLQKQREGSPSPDEERQLEQFEQAELLIRLVKARVRAQEVS